MPIFVDLDVVVLHPFPCSTHTLLVRVLQDVLAVLRVYGVQDVEEILPVRMFALRKVIWHEHHKFKVLANFRPQFCHRKLVVARHVDA